jgi:protein-S-isoprenylcysteine O-methyltransferase Ste14
MDLVGSGDRIGLFMLPFLVIGLALNIIFPAWFSVGGPAQVLKIISIVLLVPGVVLWIWSVVLILVEVPEGRLITTGPYALVKHPLYTSVALLVLPWAGLLLNSWLGAVLGLALYAASRLYAPAEEKKLAGEFGPAWEAYCGKVLLPWL